VDLSALIDGVAVRYATDPAYSGKVHSIAAMPEVFKALAQFRSA
jgi:flagellum-specific peptidoglycan hydrolase FlgJ